MHLVANFPSRGLRSLALGPGQFKHVASAAAAKWIDGYLSGFGVVADVDKGVDSDCDA